MERRRIQSLRRYILSFIIASFIFLLIFFLSTFVSYYYFQQYSYLQDKLSYKIFKDKLMIDFFNESLCDETSFRRMSQDLGFHVSIMSELEKKFGKYDPKVLFRKRFYSLVQLEHFKFVKEYNERCGGNYSSILFFYSNKKDEVEESERVGRLLDAVYIRNENLVIYSFDINLDDEVIRKLREKYNVSKSPTVIINENVSLISPKDINEIERYLR